MLLPGRAARSVAAASRPSAVHGSLMVSSTLGQWQGRRSWSARALASSAGAVPPQACSCSSRRPSAAAWGARRREGRGGAVRRAGRGRPVCGRAARAAAAGGGRCGARAQAGPRAVAAVALDAREWAGGWAGRNGGGRCAARASDGRAGARTDLPGESRGSLQGARHAVLLQNGGVGGHAIQRTCGAGKGGRGGALGAPPERRRAGAWIRARERCCSRFGAFRLLMRTRWHEAAPLPDICRVQK
jgi:hypothetical protein